MKPGVCVPRFNLLCLEKCWDLKTLRNVSEQKRWHHLFVSIQPPELCGCNVLLSFLKMFCLTPRQANHTENHFSNSKYPHTLAGDTCKDLSSVSWEEMGINHQNGSVNVITQYHHHTVIPPNLDQFSSWATTWRKAGKLHVSDQIHVFIPTLG